jgi:hypothetical protein
LTNYNKTRINIGHQHERWMELKEALRFQINTECKHQCHCACSSQIRTCIINDAERRAAQKTTKMHIVYSCFEGKTFKTIPKLNDIIPLTNSVAKDARYFHQFQPNRYHQKQKNLRT